MSQLSIDLPPVLTTVNAVILWDSFFVLAA